jgi:putative acetyltransferase
MNIRAERPSDHAAISALTEAAFKQADEARLVEALRASGDSMISLVAEADGEIIGHVLFSKLVSPARCLGLGPVSVTPARQREGIGAALIKHGLEVAARDGWQAVFLLGDPAYYTRFGFRVEDAAKFSSPYPKEYLMARALVPGALTKLNGALIYAPPFSTFE